MPRIKQIKKYGFALLFLLGSVGGSCRRMPDTTTQRTSATTVQSHRDALCVEHAEGCIYCTVREGPTQVFLEPDQSRPLLCNPKDEGDCVEFCTVLAPECAAPWISGRPCLLDSELAFQRAVFNRDTAEKPEVQFQGRVVDENGKRIDGASIDVWVTRTAQPTATLAQEISGKDGTFRLHLRIGPWGYALRIQRPGYATEIIEGLAPEKLNSAGNSSQPRIFRLEPESMMKGRIVEDTPLNSPISGAVISAMRSPEEWIEVSNTVSAEDGTFTLGGLENRRYHLRIRKFGWKPAMTKNLLSGNTNRVAVRLTRATVIRGVVEDKDGNPEPYATVAALLSESPGFTTTPIFWSSDAMGRFAQDRFAPGIYYLWARKGEMLAYPPEKIELDSGGDVSVTLSLDHRGSKVMGTVIGSPGYTRKTSLRALLSSRSSPLAFPRPAVAAVDSKTGTFTFQGILPGRYEISILDGGGTRNLAILSGPRDVEIPIDADTPVQLKAPLVIRPVNAE